MKAIVTDSGIFFLMNVWDKASLKAFAQGGKSQSFPLGHTEVIVQMPHKAE